MDPRRKKFCRILLAIYGAGLLWILFARNRYDPGVPYWEQVHRYLNLRPLETISLYWRLLVRPVRPVLTRLAIYNLAGNILLFLPMGILIPLVFPRLRSLLRTLAAVALLMAAAEILQVLFLAGSCDIDDLILNLLGTALGYPLGYIFRKDE